jgi:tripartite-type tricarboxylate transporter receptor subunit TctC
MPQLPEVAPLSEGAQGLAGYELLNWFGMFATAGTPAPIVERLNAIMTAALNEPKMAETLYVQGIVPRPMSVPQYKAFVDAETTKFAAIIERAGIKLEG